MARPLESQLYRELVDSRFRFIDRGMIEINDIYDAVKRRYPNLCDDEFTCVHQQNAGLHQSEWKHIVRSALLHILAQSGQRFLLIPDSVLAENGQ